MGQGERGPQQPAHQRPGTINMQCQKCPLLANVPQMWELSNWQNKDFYAKKYRFLKFQLAIPQLLPGGQFPFSYSTGQPIPGYYIPQPIAQVFDNQKYHQDCGNKRWGEFWRGWWCWNPIQKYFVSRSLMLLFPFNFMKYYCNRRNIKGYKTAKYETQLLRKWKELFKMPTFGIPFAFN